MARQATLAMIRSIQKMRKNLINDWARPVHNQADK